MEHQKRLIDGLNLMGYDGPIPKLLTSVCNPSTYLIWGQFVQNVKPKQEVEKARRKIITERLNKKSLKKQDEFQYPIKEIELHKQKIQLENELEKLNHEIDDKGKQIDEISQTNKALFINCDLLKQQIKECNERKFLVNKRSENIESNIRKVQEMLTLLRNLTPIESDELTSPSEITKTLQKCVEKLEKGITKIQSKPTLKNTTGKKSVKKSCAFNKENSFKSAKKLNYTNFECSFRETSVLSCVGENRKKSVESTTIKGRKDSLGLLPESYMDMSGDDFLLGSPDCFIRSDIRETVIMHNLTQISNPYLQNKQPYSVEKLQEDEFVIKNVKDVLYRYNRKNIFNCLEEMCDESVKEITKATNQVSSYKVSKVNKIDMASVHSTHINIELDIVSLSVAIKKLERKVSEKKKQVLKTLMSSFPEKVAEIKRNLELQLENVGLDTAIEYYKKELVKPKSKNELLIAENKLVQVNTDLQSKVTSIEEFLELISQTLKNVQSTREQTTGSVLKLNNFTCDYEWAAGLLHKITLEEMKVFNDFNLEFNRRFSHTDPKVYYRNVLCNTLPSYVCVDSDLLYFLSVLLDTPYNLPEVVLLNVLKRNARFNALKSLETPHVSEHKVKHNMEELTKKESYVQETLDEINTILSSNGTNKVLQFSGELRKIVKIWKHTQFQDFISV